MGVEGHAEHFRQYRVFVEELDEKRVNELLLSGRDLRHEKLTYDMLTPDQRVQVDKAAWQILVCIAMAAFVVTCFVTEAIPQPGVAFFIGLILVF
jgi:hypothetical protein